MDELIQNSITKFFELKSVSNYRLNDNLHIYGSLKAFGDQKLKLGIGFKYFIPNKDENKNHISVVNIYVNSDLAFKADVKIKINENVKLVSGLTNKNGFVNQYFNLSINTNKH